jgi:hypothetical protein
MRASAIIFALALTACASVEDRYLDRRLIKWSRHRGTDRSMNRWKIKPASNKEEEASQSNC